MTKVIPRTHKSIVNRKEMGKKSMSVNRAKKNVIEEKEKRKRKRKRRKKERRERRKGNNEQQMKLGDELFIGEFAT